jgi:hypothetical protein
MLIIRRVTMTAHFLRSYSTISPDIQKAFGKQLGLLISNASHPSLDLTLYDKAKGLWQARITKGYRFYFTTMEDLATLHEIKEHD